MTGRGLTVDVLLVHGLVTVLVLVFRRTRPIRPRLSGVDDAVASGIGSVPRRGPLVPSAGELRDAQDCGVGVFKIRHRGGGAGRLLGCAIVILAFVGIVCLGTECERETTGFGCDGCHFLMSMRNRFHLALTGFLTHHIEGGAGKQRGLIAPLRNRFSGSFQAC